MWCIPPPQVRSRGRRSFDVRRPSHGKVSRRWRLTWSLGSQRFGWGGETQTVLVCVLGLCLWFVFESLWSWLNKIHLPQKHFFTSTLCLFLVTLLLRHLFFHSLSFVLIYEHVRRCFLSLWQWTRADRSNGRFNNGPESSNCSTWIL